MLGATQSFLNPDTEKEGLPAGGKAPQEGWPGSMTHSCPLCRNSPALTFSWPLGFVVLWLFLLCLALAFLVFFPFATLRSLHCAQCPCAALVMLPLTRQPLCSPSMNAGHLAEAWWLSGGKEALSPWFWAPWRALCKDFSVERVCERPAGAS